MVAEFSIVPIGVGESVGAYVAECLKIVVASGIRYKVNPLGTVVEGEYDEVMALIRKCHKRVARLCPRVITTIKIDDRKGRKDMLDSKIRSLERRLGRKLET